MKKGDLIQLDLQFSNSLWVSGSPEVYAMPAQACNVNNWGEVSEQVRPIGPDDIFMFLEANSTFYDDEKIITKFLWDDKFWVTFLAPKHFKVVQSSSSTC